MTWQPSIRAARSFAEQAKLDVRTQCVPTALAYPTSTLHQPPIYPGYSVSPLGAGQPCPAAKSATPNTLPPATLTVTDPDGTIRLAGRPEGAVIRQPSKDSDPKTMSPKTMSAARPWCSRSALYSGRRDQRWPVELHLHNLGHTVSLNAVRTTVRRGRHGRAGDRPAPGGSGNDPNAPCNNPDRRVGSDHACACSAIRVDCFLAPSLVASGGRILKLDNVIFRACDASLGVTCVSSNTIVETQVNFAHSGSSPVSQTYIQAWSVNR